MTLQDVIDQLKLTVFTAPHDPRTLTPRGGYASDLLSCVMAGAQPDNLWVTLQAHMNVVAVAALREVTAVIITEGSQPEADVLAKAGEQGIVLLGTTMGSYEVVGKLWELGIR
jgi:hypothetical protein